MSNNKFNQNGFFNFVNDEPPKNKKDKGMDEYAFYDNRRYIEKYINVIEEETIDGEIHTEGIEDATFEDVFFSENVFDNTTYAKNCTFKNCKFAALNIRNFLFTGCQFDDETLFYALNINSLTFSNCEIEKINIFSFTGDCLYFKDTELNAVLRLGDCYVNKVLFANVEFKDFLLTSSRIKQLLFATCQLEKGSQFDLNNDNRVDEVKCFYCNFEIHSTEETVRVRVDIDKRAIEALINYKEAERLPVDFDPRYTYPGGEDIADLPDEIFDESLENEFDLDDDKFDKLLKDIFDIDEINELNKEDDLI